MAKRILMVVTPQTTGDLRSAARSAAVVARESGGQAAWSSSARSRRRAWTATIASSLTRTRRWRG
jgi:hypothetical protein